MQIGLWSLGVRAQPYGMGVGDNQTAKNTIFTDC